jgi:hypothetical protein
MVEDGEMEFDEEAGELDASFEVSLLQALPKVSIHTRSHPPKNHPAQLATLTEQHTRALMPIT